MLCKIMAWQTWSYKQGENRANLASSLQGYNSVLFGWFLLKIYTLIPNLCFEISLDVFVRNVSFGWIFEPMPRAFIIYMFRWSAPKVFNWVSDNSLISGFGKTPMAMNSLDLTWLDFDLIWLIYALRQEALLALIDCYTLLSRWQDCMASLYLVLSALWLADLTTVRCRYNAVSFLHIPHNRHSIARPLGRGMGCLMWFSCLSHVLLLSVQRCVWNRDKLNRVITALDCTDWLWDTLPPLNSG